MSKLAPPLTKWVCEKSDARTLVENTGQWVPLNLLCSDAQFLMQ
jgi:hypothetical protein